MNADRQSLGRAGEKAAAKYLRRNGYRIIETNWRCPIGEIDIIARKDDILVFCEVKARQNLAFGLPEEAVTANKQARLRKLGDYYWNFKSDKKQNPRFDVLSIIARSGGLEIEHIEDAF